MAQDRIDTKTGRDRLEPRRSPYWHKLAVRKHLGYRKLADGSGRWIARLTTPERKYLHQALGDDAELSFDDASEAARSWFGDTDPKVVKGANLRYTLQQAVDDYASHLKAEKTERASREARGRLSKHLSEKLLRTQVADLKTADLKRWRDSMVKTDDDPEVVRKSKDSANRVLNWFKAALNLAWRSGLVADDTAWRRVEAFRKVGRARDYFASPEEIAALIAHSPADLALLIYAGVLTGARLGELGSARVRDLDRTEGTLLVDGKTGSRVVYLSEEAVDLFTELAAGKTRSEPLLKREDGKAWTSDDVQRPFREAVEAAGLPEEATYYSLRHFHISRALLSGVQPQVVAENCGTSLRMIEQHYGKFLKTDRRAMFNGVAL